MQKLIITVTIPLPADPLSASKVQTAALEAGEVFKKAVSGVDKKAEYEAKVVRVRSEDAPKLVRAKKSAPEPEQKSLLDK